MMFDWIRVDTASIATRRSGRATDDRIGSPIGVFVSRQQPFSRLPDWREKIGNQKPPPADWPATSLELQRYGRKHRPELSYLRVPGWHGRLHVPTHDRQTSAALALAQAWRCQLKGS